jgi:hypothetical protein
VNHRALPVTDTSRSVSRVPCPLKGPDTLDTVPRAVGASVSNRVRAASGKRSDTLDTLPVFSTWVLYPDPDQVPVKDPARLVARLHLAGVEVSPLEDGTLAVTGPSQWFTDDSRRELRRRVVAIVVQLVASKGGDDAAA